MRIFLAEHYFIGLDAHDIFTRNTGGHDARRFRFHALPRLRHRPAPSSDARASAMPSAGRPHWPRVSASSTDAAIFYVARGVAITHAQRPARTDAAITDADDAAAY